MKTNLLSLLLALFATFSFVSCDDDDTVDTPPVAIEKIQNIDWYLVKMTAKVGESLDYTSNVYFKPKYHFKQDGKLQKTAVGVGTNEATWEAKGSKFAFAEPGSAQVEFEVKTLTDSKLELEYKAGSAQTINYEFTKTAPDFDALTLTENKWKFVKAAKVENDQVGDDQMIPADNVKTFTFLGVSAKDTYSYQAQDKDGKLKYGNWTIKDGKFSYSATASDLSNIPAVQEQKIVEFTKEKLVLQGSFSAGGEVWKRTFEVVAK